MADAANAQRALATVEAFFKEKSLRYEPIEGRDAFRIGFQIDNGDVRCIAHVDSSLEVFTWYTYFPTNVPDQFRNEVASFLTRANYGLTIGNFEMDYSDGEVRFKVSMDFAGNQLVPMQVGNTISTSLQTVDRYLPGMMSIIYGGKTAEQACADVEKKQG